MNLILNGELAVGCEPVGGNGKKMTHQVFYFGLPLSMLARRKEMIEDSEWGL